VSRENDNVFARAVRASASEEGRIALKITPTRETSFVRHDSRPVFRMPVVTTATGRLARAGTKIGLLHHVGGGNLGDDATLQAVAENIRRRRPAAEIIAFSMNPDDTEARHGMRSFPVRRRGWSIGYKAPGTEQGFKASVRSLVRRHGLIFKLVKAAGSVVRLTGMILGELSFLMSSRRHVRSLDLLMICGGGQLTERDGPWGFPYTIFKWVALARSAGVRCVFLNVGAGPLALPLTKYFARRALSAADYVSLRDAKSKALLDEIGYAGDSRVYPDSAYGLEFATKKGVSQGGAQPIVGFAPMPYPHPRMYGAEKDRIAYDAFIAKFAGFASWLVAQSCALTLFGTDIGVDPLAIEDVRTALLDHHGVPSSQYGVDRSMSVQELLTAMSKMDVVVTCRFHGVIFAHLLNKPVLAIAHHPKVTELMSDLGLSRYCVDIRNFDLDLLADRFAAVISDAAEIKCRMAAHLMRNKQQLSSQFDELFRC
jgi:polysaccharide pyruvyl transferase WcaK-like protein